MLPDVARNEGTMMIKTMEKKSSFTTLISMFADKIF